METSYIYELIGYVASALTIFSLLMANVLRLRFLNLVACIVWTIYGFLITSTAVMATNIILMCVNAFFIVRLMTDKEFFNIVKIHKKSLFLTQFLRNYRDDILKMYPEFKYNPNEDIYTFVAFRNVTAAGLFIFEIRDGNKLYLKLDFTIPGYQDFKITKFIYTDGSQVLYAAMKAGFSQMYCDSHKTSHQLNYLKKVGFEEQENGHLCLDLSTFSLGNPLGETNPFDNSKE